MREILFRGKTKEDGQWVQGYLVYAKSDFDGEECREADIVPHDTDRVYKGEYNIVFPCIPETISEFTGICDKNGKKIFEGDYIVCRQAIQGNFIDEHIEKGYVEMKHGAFGLHRKQGWYRPFKDWLEDYEYEVIGNIHDNPELLEGGNE